jgi:SAM-dependent methyltransferase
MKAGYVSRLKTLFSPWPQDNGRQVPVWAYDLPTLRTVLAQRPPNILSEISPNDTMRVKGQEAQYAQVGLSALKCIRMAMLAAQKEEFQNILDFPCGHGRVLRVLKAAFPQARFTACDLDGDGVDFCASKLGAVPVYSAEEPEQIPLRDSFDLIWCGSLLTHLDHPRWLAFLKFFASILSPGGLLLFTTHGRLSVRWIETNHFTFSLRDIPAILKQYHTTGFGYEAYSAHAVQNYGTSISSPAWVIQQLMKVPQLRLASFTEEGWNHHQDVIVCARV